MVSISETKPNLLPELFATALSAAAILALKPSDVTKKRASELLDLNRNVNLDRESAKKRDQFDRAETMMRLVKARIPANQVED